MPSGGCQGDRSRYLRSWGVRKQAFLAGGWWHPGSEKLQQFPWDAQPFSCGSPGKTEGARQDGAGVSAPPCVSEHGLYMNTGWKGAVIQIHPEYTRGFDGLEHGTCPSIPR